MKIDAHMIHPATSPRRPLAPPAFLKYKVLLGLFLGWTAAAPLFAAGLTLTPAADTTLIELFPDNNMGAQPHVNAGTTLGGNFNRGLFRFDLVGQIPAGAKIKSVQLSLFVIGQPTDMPADSTFQLHRMLRPWGEGDQTSAGGPGRGAPATTNEATWNQAFALTTNLWTVPGGQSGTDYAAVSSSEQFIYGPNTFYDFSSTARLVEDVQSWLNDAGTNFGWLLKTADEGVLATARRFSSREDIFNTPVLSVEYLPPPVLKNVQSNGAQVHFTFLAEGGQAYVVETRASLFTNQVWTVLTNIAAPPETTNIPVTVTLAADQRFYRVVAP